MKLKQVIRSILQLPTSIVAFARHPRPAPAEQLDLGLDDMTTTGLRLRDAMPVRAAEHWLQLGEPNLALRELDSLPESSRRHPWAMRVHLAAVHATTTN